MQGAKATFKGCKYDFSKKGHAPARPSVINYKLLYNVAISITNL